MRVSSLAATRDCSLKSALAFLKLNMYALALPIVDASKKCNNNDCTRRAYIPAGFQTDGVYSGKRSFQECSSCFVYIRIILLTLFVGAMLWSMALLRRGQLRMVVDVVGSC